MTATTPITRVEPLSVVGDRLTARVPPQPSHPMFAGHFPGFALMPGVYLMDFVHRAVQTAVPDVSSVELVEVESCRFLGPSYPGDELLAEVTLARSGDSLRCAATVSTSRGRAAEVRFVCRQVETCGESVVMEAPITADSPRPVGGPAIIDANGIARIIPHRPPMLLLDRVSEVVPRQRLTAHRTVAGTELVLAGSAPGMCAPLLVESWAQAALVLLLWEQPNPDVLAGQVAVVGVVEGVRFGRPVRTGEEIEHSVSFTRRYGDMAIVRGSAQVDGMTVMEVDRMVTALRPAAALHSG